MKSTQNTSGVLRNLYMYEFNGEDVELIDKRESKKIPGEKHRWGKSLKIMNDCDVVICLQIGMTAKPGLKGEGKRVVEDEGTVEEVLKRFVEHEKFLKKPLNF